MENDQEFFVDTDKNNFNQATLKDGQT